MNIKKQKITLFGDSIGKGIMTEGDKLRIASPTAVRLYEAEYDTGIINASRFGQTMAKSYERGVFREYADRLDGDKENVAVIELGGNDCAYFWQNVAKEPDVFHDSVTPLNNFVRYYDEAISFLLSKGVRVYCCSLVPIDAKRYFDNVIGKLCDKNKVLEFFRGDYTTIYRHHELFSGAITEICHKRRVPVIDLRSPFLNTLDLSYYLCADGVHPNERGQKLIYEGVSAFRKNFTAA